ncbi:hypothetical protein NOR_05187 [Metarhizium rileyi]|uniref:Uncharacterized protein n=1 Tax=Metarhizium rileyi (strain RCEF 4871) TaxID=1649241 RepID=A0A167CX22_METRR|nr:hypothetical protein NOR_05187 [Metarhizium rileyi RCEF 4871]
MNKTAHGFVFTARRLAVAVITQLFSYMIGKGSTAMSALDRHSSFFTFQTILPKSTSRLHRTAVAQVFAFVLQSLRAGPPPETWHDEAETLGIWAVEDSLSLALAQFSMF